MKATYLGLELSSPVVVSSSPYTASVANIERCAHHGAGAVVLKSIFEEQVVRQAASLGQMDGYGDAGEYLERYLGDAYKGEFLELVRGAVKTGIPVIASINCYAASQGWVEYAVAMQQAGAAAIELNIFLLPTDRHHTGGEIEQIYAGIVGRVVEAVTIPVSVKLSMRFTNVLSVCDSLLGYGARGVVLFNRFFEPDIDIESLELVPGDPFSEASELRNVLRTTALCAAAVPQLNIAVSTGVHDGAGAVKAILCGAHVVQVCTAIHQSGYEAIGRINEFVDRWSESHNFCSISEFRGWMNYGKAGEDLYQRAQYMKYFPHEAQ